MQAAAGPMAAHNLDPGTKLVILLGGMLAALALTAINSVLPLIDKDLAHTPQDSMLVKQLIGGVGLAMVAGAALSGLLVDRLGLRRVMIVASLVYVIAGTAGLYVDDLRTLLASRLLLGFSAACIQIASLTLINTRLEGQQRARWMGIHVSVAMFGTIAVHPVAGNLGEFGWRYPFALYVLGLLLLAGMLFGRPAGSSTPAPREVADRAENVPRAERFTWPSWFPFHYLPFAVLIGSIVFLPSVYLPFLLRQFGASPATISYVLTADSIAGAGMALLYGPGRRYLSAHAAFVFSFSVVAAGTLFALLSSTMVGVIAGMVLYGFGIGWLVPNLITSLGDKVAKERQGKAAGFVKAAHFLAAPLAVLIMEPIAHRYGPSSAIMMVTVIATALAALMLARLAWGAHQTRRTPLRLSESAGVGLT